MDHGVTFQRAGKADAMRLAEFQVAAWRESYRDLLPDWSLEAISVEDRAEAWRLILGCRSLSKVTHAWMALSGETLVGLAAVGPQRDAALRDAGFEADVQAVYVAPPQKRRGLGTRLLRHVFRDAKTDGATGASISVLRGAKASERFVSACGAVALDVSPTLTRSLDTRVFGWTSLAVPLRPTPLAELRASEPRWSSSETSRPQSPRPDAQ